VYVCMYVCISLQNACECAYVYVCLCEKPTQVGDLRASPTAIPIIIEGHETALNGF
jgi:hypothetical protein